VCERCNVVVVSIDTLRADHVGAYGYGRPTTPNLDSLAAGAVLFENAISQSSWTRPAHMSIFTGLHPAEHGYVGLIDRGRLDASVPTLASVLRANGYHTIAFTGGVNVAAVYGFDNGFDLYRSNGKSFRDNLEETRYWLTNEAEEPFFLFWHGYDAHTPYTNDPIDRDALGLPAKPRRLGLRRTCRDPGGAGRIGKVVDEYDAAIHRADRYLGKLVSELSRRALLESTVIVVLSDHGEEFLDHGGCLHLNTLYREVLHVPLVIRSPGLEARRVPDLVPASISIGRTILDLVGVRDDTLPGVSLAGVAAGGAAPSGPVVSETLRRPTRTRGRGHVRALTLPSEKLVDWSTLGKREWFDSTSDLRESAPLTSGPRVQRAADMLARWVATHPLRATGARSGPDESAERDREMERELRSLGYLE